MKPKIWLSPPHMGYRERLHVQDVFDSNWIAPLGPHVDAFEKELAQSVQTEHVAVLSSGTAALHLSLILLGVERGDEVICQSFTFSASANPIVYQGATPVFIDSEKDTWNMSPNYLRIALEDRVRMGKKPKAIIVVDLYGMPAKFKEILSIANEYDIPVVEDAAEALGATYDNKPCGSFGKFGILSFNGNKIITTSSGGALVSNEAALIARARHLATQARDPAPHYQHSDIGYNYRMSNVLAAIGRGQLEVLADRVEARRRNFNFYREAIGTIEGITFLEEPEGSFSNRWLTCILVDPSKTGGKTREDIRLALDADNVESRPLWKPMHLQPVFDGMPYYGEKVCERLFDQGLCLPSGSAMTTADLERVAGVVRKVVSSR